MNKEELEETRDIIREKLQLEELQIERIARGKLEK